MRNARLLAFIFLATLFIASIPQLSPAQEALLLPINNKAADACATAPRGRPCIASADVAFTAIQGLHKLLEEKEVRIVTLENQNARLEDRLGKLEAIVVELADDQRKSENGEQTFSSWLLRTFVIAAEDEGKYDSERGPGLGGRVRDLWKAELNRSWQNNRFHFRRSMDRVGRQGAVVAITTITITGKGGFYAV